MKVNQNITELIGNTPMVFWREDNLCAKIALKLESFNPSGSIKDRVALFMVEDALERGILQADGEIIEPTSGNTGIGLAMVCADKELKLTIVMPENMSIERIKLMEYYGAKVVLTPAPLGMSGAIEEAQKLQKQNSKSIILNQFSNPANPQAHYMTTGPEIWAQTEGKIDILVAGVGTGGTISGCSKFLKEQNSSIQTVAIEPEESAVLSGKPKGVHGIQGIGAGFIPENYEVKFVDKIISISTSKAIETAKFAGKKGISAGISAGAALAVARELAKVEENAGKLIVVIMPDDALKYMSTKLFEKD